MAQRVAHRSALERERSAARIIELFQVKFLAVASVELPGADHVVKGGVNMRFFFQSHRSSKDMDFDYIGQRFATFADRVDRLIGGRALAELLRLERISIGRMTRAKATATTQRWKFGLAGPGVPDASSKVEFSARGSDLPYELAPIDDGLAARLRTRPVKLNHYLPEAAVSQKVHALRGRTRTEPRDVFDLDHLFTRHPEALAGASVEAAALNAAADRASDLTYAEFESTVVPYLDEDLRPLLGNEPAWTSMQLRVIDRLRTAARERA